MLFGTIYGCGTFRSKGNNTMKISKSQLRELIKEEFDSSLEEGMFGNIGGKIMTGIKQMLLLPSQLIVGGLLGYVSASLPRDDFKVADITPKMMVAFTNKIATPDFKESGGVEKFANDWQNMSRDDLIAEYFTLSEGPFTKYVD